MKENYYLTEYRYHSVDPMTTDYIISTEPTSAIKAENNFGCEIIPRGLYEKVSHARQVAHELGFNVMVPIPDLSEEHYYVDGPPKFIEVWTEEEKPSCAYAHLGEKEYKCNICDTKFCGFCGKGNGKEITCPTCGHVYKDYV